VEIRHLGSDKSKFVEADMVILSTGVRPRTYLVQDTDIKLHIDESKGRLVGGILVNEYQQTSDPDIYAAGDICSGIMDCPFESNMSSVSTYLSIPILSNTGYTSQAILARAG